MRTKLMSVLMAVASVLIIIGVIIMAQFLAHPNGNGDIIKVDINTSEDQSVHFEGLALIPGHSTEYTVSLVSKVEGEYDVTLSFAEENEELTLKNFVYAKIETPEGVLCDKLLADLMDGDKISFSCDLSDKETYDIKITYYMPDDVGNEAQNAEADFSLIITANNMKDWE